jgi:lipopolysaccharide export system protein LptA
MHATAGRADYEGSGEWVHLTESPRVDDGNVQLTAEKVDVSQASGDAFAHGNVKATSFGGAADAASGTPRRNNAGQSSIGLGGQGPSHVVADEAEMRKSTGESIFRGHARLWQEANSVAAPIIVLNRQRQTLVATSPNPTDPVRAVMLSADMAAPGQKTEREPAEADHAKPKTPSVIRMSGGALRYSDAERKALMTAGAAGTVIAETPTAHTTSDQVELVLLPPNNHAGRDGGSAQVDTMTATGHVVVSSGNRRGNGSQLVYTGSTGDYVLTGAAMPPKMTDPARGTVTGDALIFHSRDDSVSIEGGTAKTATETRTPK